LGGLKRSGLLRYIRIVVVCGELSWKLTVKSCDLPSFGAYFTDPKYLSNEAEFLGALMEFREFQDEELVKKSSFVFGG